MPGPQTGNYNLGFITTDCEPKGGIITVELVQTDDTASVHIVLFFGGEIKGSFTFGTNTVNGSVAFDGLQKGLYSMERRGYIGSTPGPLQEDGIDLPCGPAVPTNTGFRAYNYLEEYYTDNNEITGRIKPNIPADADYVAPEFKPDLC